MSGKPEGETVQKLHILQIRQKAEFDVLVRMLKKRQRHSNKKKRQTERKRSVFYKPDKTQMTDY